MGDEGGEAAKNHDAQKVEEPSSQQNAPDDEDEIFITENDHGRTKILTMNVRSAVGDEKSPHNTGETY